MPLADGGARERGGRPVPAWKSQHKTGPTAARSGESGHPSGLVRIAVVEAIGQMGGVKDPRIDKALLAVPDFQ